MKNIYLRMIFLVLFICIYGTCVVHGDETCTTPRGGHGMCIKLQDCKLIYDVLKKSTKTQADLDLLKESKCEDTSKTCCPLKCITPRGEFGKCLEMKECSHVVNKEDALYLAKSTCKGNDNNKICCNPDPLRHNLNKRCTAELTAFPPDPKSKCCGYDSGSENRIIGGNATKLEQYPWLALLMFEINGTKVPLCGGALISSKYVLTAAHCVSPKTIEMFGDPKSVSLGDYDITNEGNDCIDIEAGGRDCNEGVTMIDIESYIVHPAYTKSTNDIALLRLAKQAPFTDFIRPICLPSNDITLKPPENFRMYVAGWGQTENSVQSAIKLHVDVPYVALNECQIPYKVAPYKRTLSDKQICAGGELDKDSCRGDSGGALTYERNNAYEIIGVVSFGPSPCAAQSIPSVYTKVFAYIEWIRETITA